MTHSQETLVLFVVVIANVDRIFKIPPQLRMFLLYQRKGHRHYSNNPESLLTVSVTDIIIPKFRAWKSYYFSTQYFFFLFTYLK